jgi:hypothetical protein
LAAAQAMAERGLSGFRSSYFLMAECARLQ